MTNDRTFRVDNALIQNAAQIYGSKTPKPGQMYLPGMEPLGLFDLWMTLGCYSLLDPDKPTAEVFTTLTEVLEVMSFSRTLTEADGYGWMSYSTDTYSQVKEAFHRLRTVEFPIRGEWDIRDRRGKVKRRLVEYQTGILSYYGYVYPKNVIPPDQLPATKRRNVNRALTIRNEAGPEILIRDDVAPIGITFQMSEPVVRSLIDNGPHIGTTVFRVEVMDLRKHIHPRDRTTTFLLLQTCRHTGLRRKIALDRLVASVDLPAAQAGRNRETVLSSLAKLQAVGVVESFTYDPTKDPQKGGQVTIIKSSRWHFPTRRGGEIEGESDD